jgi:hypothetical protein
VVFVQVRPTLGEVEVVVVPVAVLVPLLVVQVVHMVVAVVLE